MASQLCDLPTSSQLPSTHSALPLSDDEVLEEITVDLDTASISPIQPTNTHNTKNTVKMPPKPSRSGSQPKRQSQRQLKKKRLYQANPSEDELGGEIHMPPSITESSIPAKRSRSNSISKPTPKPAAKRTKPAVARQLKKWEPEFVTLNAKSPLVTNGVDLRTLLLQPAAWDVLSADDKREILSFFPQDVHILDPNTLNARPNVGSLRSNDTFRHDAEEYVANIARGMHDPEWLQQAWAAHQRRATGHFDQFYIRKVEVDWSTDIPNDHRPEHLRIIKSGASSSAGVWDDASMDGALNLGASVEFPEKNGASENGILKQNGLDKGLASNSTDGSKIPTPDHTISNGTSGVTDSVTARTEEPRKSNEGPRFEVIPSPEESEVDQAPRRIGHTKDTLNSTVPDIAVVAEVDTGGNSTDNKAENGEVTVSEKAMEVDHTKADGQSK